MKDEKLFSSENLNTKHNRPLYDELAEFTDYPADTFDDPSQTGVIKQMLPPSS